MERRDFIKASVIGVTAVSGCLTSPSSPSDSSDSNSNSNSVSETPYTRWMYAPSEVGASTFNFGFSKPPKVAEDGVNTNLNLIRRITRVGSLSFDGITSIETDNTYSLSAVGSYDAGRVANSLEGRGYQNAETYSGYDIYEGTYRGGNVSVGIGGGSHGESLLVSTGVDAETATGGVKASIDVRNGETEPYYSQDGDIATLINQLGEGSRVTGSKVPEESARNNETATGSSITVTGDGNEDAELKFVVVFGSEEDANEEIVRQNMEAQDSEITRLLSYAENVSVSQDGRVVTASATVHTQVLSTVFEGSNQAIKVTGGSPDNVFIRLVYDKNPFGFDHFEVVFSGDADAKVRMNEVGSQAVLHPSELLTRGGAEKMAFEDGVEAGETVTVEVVGVEGSERYTVKEIDVTIEN